MDAIMEAYNGDLQAVIPNFDEKVVRVMVRNFEQEMRPDNDHEGTVYDEFALSFPVFGDPYPHFEEVYITSRYTARIAAGSAKRD
jgi:hypothetical protein